MGLYIKHLREQIKLTQEELGKMLAEEVKTIELVKKHFGEDAVKLIEYYQSLDNKEEWFKMVQDGLR